MNTPPNVTAADVGVIESVGRDSIVAIVAIAVETVLYTIYATLVGVAGYILLRKPRKGPSTTLFLVVFIMVLLDTVLWIVDLQSIVAELSITLTSRSNLSYEARYTKFQARPSGEITAAVYSWMSNLGDSIIIWRVHAFWSRGLERLVLIVPVSLLIASCIVSCLLSDCAARFGSAFYTIVYGSYADPPFCRDIQRVSFLVAFLTTVTSTLLILYKTWYENMMSY